MNRPPTADLDRRRFLWTVSEPILRRGPRGSFDDVAVKDPSIVAHGGAQHLFYTSKGETVASGRAATSLSIGYVSAPTLEDLKHAERVDLNVGGRLCPKPLCAPQVFYYSPQELWYMIAQVPVPGKLAVLPVYLTTSDIADPLSWLRPEVLTFQRELETFWIDFWVIADDEGAVHLFYTDHDGRMYRQETSAGAFPRGFGVECEVAHVRGVDERGPWRLHEASHVYRVAGGEGGYLALLEAVRPHPNDPTYWDSRSRFMFAMVADSLRGPWRRLEPSDGDFWGDPSNLRTTTGQPSAYGQVSHPEAVRSGVDERLEVAAVDTDVLIQAFDASAIDASYQYDFLPWEIALMSTAGEPGDAT